MLPSSKTVLITGASTGIGACCARMLASSGWRVFAGTRKPTDGEALAGSAPGRIIPVQLDVTDSHSIQAAVQQVSEALNGQGLGGLVNNAGIALGGPLEFLSLDDLRYQMEVNVIGVVAVTQSFLPLIRQATPPGRIVNIGSIAGRTPLPFAAPYAASKHALEAITDSLRLELSPWDIHVSVLEPGSVATPIWNKSLSGMSRILDAMPPQAMNFYGAMVEKLRGAIQESARRGIPPEVVALATSHALTAATPKTRYLVGNDAKLRALLTLLPDRLKDRLILSKLANSSLPL